MSNEIIFLQWSTLLLWTQSVSPSAYDVQLESMPTGDDNMEKRRAQIVQSMESEGRRVLEKTRDSGGHGR